MIWENLKKRWKRRRLIRTMKRGGYCFKHGEPKITERFDDGECRDCFRFKMAARERKKEEQRSRKSYKQIKAEEAAKQLQEEIDHENGLLERRAAKDAATKRACRQMAVNALSNILARHASERDPVPDTTGRQIGILDNQQAQGQQVNDTASDTSPGPLAEREHPFNCPCPVCSNRRISISNIAQGGTQNDAALRAQGWIAGTTSASSLSQAQYSEARAQEGNDLAGYSGITGPQIVEFNRRISESLGLGGGGIAAQSNGYQHGPDCPCRGCE